VPEILERTLDPRVAPRRILFRHSTDQLADFGEDAATACSGLSVGPFARDELPVPAKQRVRRDDRRGVAHRLPPQPVRPRGESSPVIISKPQAPPAQLSPQHPILFDQVRHHLPFAAI
jgi:hypothetical protein